MERTGTEHYVSPPKDEFTQMKIPGLDDHGEKLIQDAERWKARHYWAYNRFENWAIAEYESTGRPISSTAVRYFIRDRMHIPIANHEATGIARICERDTNGKAQFSKSNSLMDPFL